MSISISGGEIGTLLDRAPCGFVVIADDGRIREVNATLRTLLGYERGEIEGEHLARILSAGGRVFYQTHLFPLLRMRGKVDEIYLTLRTRNGEEIPVLLNGVRYAETDDEANGTNAVNSDARSECVFVPMYQRSRFEEEILRAKRAAEDATGARDLALTDLRKVHSDLETHRKELQTQQEHLLTLNAALQNRAEQEALLNQIGRILRTSQDAEETLSQALRALGQAIRADRCCFAEYDLPQRQSRVVADWHRPDLPSLRGTYPLTDFGVSLQEIYGPNGVWQSDDLLADQAPDQGVSAVNAARVSLGMRSGVGVAVLKEGIPSAALNVAMTDAPRRWTPEEVQLIQSVMTMIHAVSEEIRLRDRERRIALVLQDALQPPISETVPGLSVAAFYRVALAEASVGGDFYDVFPLKEGCHALVVADLSGKGLEAASQVAMIRHMLRTILLQRGGTLAQGLSDLNEMLTEHSLLRGFATLFVGAYDGNAHTLTYVNAGQEPGLLRRGATGQIEELGATGPVLGGFAGGIFAEEITVLNSGDVLALFTDGLTEAGTNRKKLLEIDGISEIFASSSQKFDSSPAEIIERTMAGVETAVTPAGIRDDVCLLVARIQ